MAWYRAGTIAVTNGSTAVVGTSTQWIANVNIGEGLLGPDGRIYEVAAIASDTSITLASAYLGSTASGQAYAIAPTQSYIRDLAAEVAALVTEYGTLADGAVRFDEAQSLTTEQATQARSNTGSAAAADLTAHIGDTTDAHDASAISVVPTGGIAATNVQAALEELDTEKATAANLTSHTGASSGAHAASAISVSATGGISATNVQAAVAELDTEKFDKSGGTITGDSTLGAGGTGSTNAIWNINGSSASSYGPQIRFQRNSITKWTVGSYSGINGGSSDDLLVYSGASGFQLWTGGASTFTVNASGHWVPGANNTSDVGTAGLAIKQIYTVNSVIVTSDARLKTTRQYSKQERAVARRLRNIGLAYQWNRAIAEKGANNARFHFGATVQSVMDAFEAEGLDPFRYAVVCYDEWAAEVRNHPAVTARAAVPAQAAVYETRERRETVVVDGEEVEMVRTYLHEVSPAIPAQAAVQARAAYTETVREAGNRYSLRLDQLAFFIATAGA